MATKRASTSLTSRYLVPAVALATFFAGSAQASAEAVGPEAPGSASSASILFDQIAVRGPEKGSCTYVDGDRQRVYTCTNLSPHLISSAVQIRFPNRDMFQANVALTEGSHTGSRLEWFEQTTSDIPIVTHYGQLRPGQSKTLAGDLRPWSEVAWPGWDLGIDPGPGVFGAPRNISATITVTYRPKSPKPPAPQPSHLGSLGTSWPASLE